MSPQSLVLSISATQNNSPLDPLSHLCPISPIRFACIFSFFYLFCRWNRTCTTEWNWRLQQLAQLTHVPCHQVLCPSSIWPLVMPFGWDTTNCVLLWSVVNIPWLICAACASYILYLCYTCRPVNYRLPDRRAAGVVISHRSWRHSHRHS